jgi:hypothetical protein
MDSFDFKMRKPEQVVDSVVSKLKKHGKGIVLMHDFQHPTSLALPELLVQLKSSGYKIVQMVIYIGHSLGADSALRFTQAAHNFKLPLICPVDPVSWDSNAQQVVPGRWEVGSNVERVIGYRTNTFPGGGRIVLAAGNTVTNLTDTTLNVPHASPPGGLDIASSPEVHAAIVAGVHDVVTQMQAVA